MPDAAAEPPNTRTSLPSEGAVNVMPVLDSIFRAVVRVSPAYVTLPLPVVVEPVIVYTELAVPLVVKLCAYAPASAGSEEPPPDVPLAGIFWGSSYPHTVHLRTLSPVSVSVASFVTVHAPYV